MSSKPNILFVHDHSYEEFWMDGVWAALNILDEKYNIKRLNFAKELITVDPTAYDLVLAYGGFHSPPQIVVYEWKQKYPNLKTGLLICGNSFEAYGLDKWDVLFYETKLQRSQISYHHNFYHAYGTNTDIYFKPDLPFPIVWDYIGVGAFAKWKRWEKMIEKKGTKLVIGEYQKGNEQESLEIVRNLISNGVMVSNMVHPFELHNLYCVSRTLYMPADINGGGERAIFEAKATGLSVEIEDDNPKLKEIKDGPIYDQIYYAKQVEKGIESCLA